MTQQLQPISREERPSHHPITPIGTPEELEKFGFRAKLYGSCSAKVVAGGTMVNLGCDEFPDCPFAKTGPENQVYRHIKTNDKILLREAPCFAALKAKKQIEGKGELFEIIGGPGTKYLHDVSKRASQVRLEEWLQENPGKKEKDAPAEMRADARASRNPKSDENFETWFEERICQPFPRPDKNPVLRDSMTALKNRNAMAQEILERRKARVAGLSIEEIDEGTGGVASA